MEGIIHICYERALPHEWRMAIEQCPIVYLPVGPLEWHGEHLAFGCDPLRAKAVLELVWQQIGGIMMPPIFLGTDDLFTDTAYELWGMEIFAKQQMPGTAFLPPDLFRRVLDNILRHLERQKLRLAVLYTGHLALQQVEIFDQLERASSGRAMRVLAWHMKRSEIPEEIGGNDIGHGAAEESSEMLSIDSGLVDLHRAGGAEVDQRLGLTADITIKASAQLGRKRLEADAESLVKAIQSTGLAAR